MKKILLSISIIVFGYSLNATAVQAGSDPVADRAVNLAKQFVKDNNIKNPKINMLLNSLFRNAMPDFVAEWKGLTGIDVRTEPLGYTDIPSKIMGEAVAKTGAFDMFNDFPYTQPDAAGAQVIRPLDDYAAKGKPDFSGIYWPNATVTPPPVSLESLYRPEVREYREGGGSAVDLIDWRGVDTPLFHCWPRSPVTGSGSGTIQLVSAPGYLLMLNEGVGNFRIIPIVGENEPQSSTSHKPSFQGSSVGHWEGDTLVVEVTNFNGKPWLGRARPPDQLPQTSSDALRIVERWSRPDSRIIEYSIVVEDPKMLTGPWTGAVVRRGLMPFDTLFESLCFPDPELDTRHRDFFIQQAERETSAAGAVEPAADGSAR